MERVLDVRQGELCWVAGTVYMDMPLKPNILDDLTKEVGKQFLLFSLCLHAPINAALIELHIGTGTSAHIPRPVRS